MLINNPNLCDERLGTFISGYSTLLLTVVFILILREIIPLLRQTVPAYYSRLDKLKRNEEANRKRAITNEFNFSVKAFANTVITTLFTDIEDKEKIKVILNAYQTMNENTKINL